MRRDTARRWIATCPLIAVATQGATSAEARGALQEAVELWLESCIERGVLERALREANFRPSVIGTGERRRPPRGQQKGGSDILGEPFAVRLTVPGYEATPPLSATA